MLIKVKRLVKVKKNVKEYLKKNPKVLEEIENKVRDFYEISNKKEKDKK